MSRKNRTDILNICLLFHGFDCIIKADRSNINLIIETRRSYQCPLRFPRSSRKFWIIHSHLSTLERNGFIRRDPTKPRAIEICDDSFQMVRTEMASLPVVGNVAAGQPILAQENIENYFPVPADILPSGESFALRVRGESMINAGILDGDLVFINSCNTARNGEIVVALIEDGATVKT